MLRIRQAARYGVQIKFKGFGETSFGEEDSDLR